MSPCSRHSSRKAKYPPSSGENTAATLPSPALTGPVRCCGAFPFSRRLTSPQQRARLFTRVFVSVNDWAGVDEALQSTNFLQRNMAHSYSFCLSRDGEMWHGLWRSLPGDIRGHSSPGRVVHATGCPRMSMLAAHNKTGTFFIPRRSKQEGKKALGVKFFSPTLEAVKSPTWQVWRFHWAEQFLQGTGSIHCSTVVLFLFKINNPRKKI